MCNDNKEYTTVAAKTAGPQPAVIQHKVGFVA